MWAGPLLMKAIGAPAIDADPRPGGATRAATAPGGAAGGYAAAADPDGGREADEAGPPGIAPAARAGGGPAEVEATAEHPLRLDTEEFPDGACARASITVPAAPCRMATRSFPGACVRFG